MVQLGRYLIPSDFTDLINSAMAVSNNIDKLQKLARKVLDDKINVVADLFKLFKSYFKCR